MKKLVEQIFEEYLLTDEYTASIKAYEATHEQYAKATKLSYDTFVKEAIDDWFEKESILLASDVEHEKKGFVHGFKLAMRLQGECRAL